MCCIEMKRQLKNNQFICVENESGRLECDGVEFMNNDVIEVFVEGTWHMTIVKYDHYNKTFKTVDGVHLLGKHVKKIASSKYISPYLNN